jgi:hypothetical protein
VKLARSSGDHREGGEAREGSGDADEASFHSLLSLSMGAVRAVSDQDFGTPAALLDGPSPIFRNREWPDGSIQAGRIAGTRARRSGKAAVFLLAVVILSVVTVRPAGGSLSALGQVRLRYAPAIFGALAI